MRLVLGRRRRARRARRFPLMVARPAPMLTVAGVVAAAAAIYFLTRKKTA